MAGGVWSMRVGGEVAPRNLRSGQERGLTGPKRSQRLGQGGRDRGMGPVAAIISATHQDLSDHHLLICKVGTMWPLPGWMWGGGSHPHTSPGTQQILRSLHGQPLLMPPQSAQPPTLGPCEVGSWTSRAYLCFPLTHPGLILRWSILQMQQVAV